MRAFLKTTETFAPGSLSLPGRYYTSPDVFDAEREAIFAKHWICVGRAEAIEKPGDFFLTRIADESVIVLRDDAGRVRAFYNVCRHRGTAICVDESGTLPGRLRCPYHGWTYDLAGRLSVAPHMDEVPGFDRSAYPLHRVAVDVCAGFIFLNLAERPEPFAEAVAPHLANFQRWALGELRAARRIDYDVPANWKIIVENYSECYHCPLVHPEFTGKVHSRSGHNDAFDGPLLGGFMNLKDGAASLTRTGARCGPALGMVDGEDLARVYFYALFPSMTISLHPDYVMTFTLQPIDAGRTTVRTEWLFAKSALAQGSCRPDEAIQFWDTTNRQDWQVCALVQQGVRSRSYRPSPLSSTESLPAAFNRQLLRALDGAEGLPASDDEKPRPGWLAQ
jgi:phenylpropionate dioxygenase-like ring-hydroxylating dioxygenase large terminal subunit